LILGGKGKTSDGEEEQQRRRPTIMATKDYYVFMDNYQRLAEGSDMSVESTGSIPMSMSNGGNSISMSVADSSVGSNNSLQTRLMHPDLRARTATRNASVSNSVVLPGIVPHTLGVDMLAAALMDNRSVVYFH
jgi:hypothetical protein